VIGQQSQLNAARTQRAASEHTRAHLLALTVPPWSDWCVPVHFDIGYTHEDSDRHYAVVTLGGDNLAIDLLQHGWAKVKTGTSKDGKERTSDSTAQHSTAAALHNSH
jgi:hypothetical protein